MLAAVYGNVQGFTKHQTMQSVLYAMSMPSSNRYAYAWVHVRYGQLYIVMCW